VVEYETEFAVTPEEFDVHEEAEKLSNQLKVHSPSEVYERFSDAKGIKQLIIQAAGELYYPLWAPEYMRCICRFLLSLPGVPEDLRRELEEKLQLPDQALQHEFARAMEERGEFSFARYFVWAKKRYPGIDFDFRKYLSEEKPGIRTKLEGKEYCVAQFGHPSKPELFLYFPVEAKKVLPPANGYMYGKVIGIVSYNPNPPLPELMPRIYLRAVCLFARVLGS